jgi:hypothetical protein
MYTRRKMKNMIIGIVIFFSLSCEGKREHVTTKAVDAINNTEEIMKIRQEVFSPVIKKEIAWIMHELRRQGIKDEILYFIASEGNDLRIGSILSYNPATIDGYTYVDSALVTCYGEDNLRSQGLILKDALLLNRDFLAGYKSFPHQVNIKMAEKMIVRYYKVIRPDSLQMIKSGYEATIFCMFDPIIEDSTIMMK